jgi:hypothetical protein
MPNHFTDRERYTLLFIIAIAAIGLLLPVIPQPEAYHRFADQRTLVGIPHFADVVSNFVFVVVGAVGLYRLKHASDALSRNKLPLSLFFLGLLLLDKGDDTVRWWVLIAWYVVAKLFELGDHAIWDLSGGLMSGHTLKYMAAGMSGIVLLQALNRNRGSAGLMPLPS